MQTIPAEINGVAIEFAPEATNDVSPMLIEGLRHTIAANVAAGFTLSRIWISSARDQHVCPSRHATGNAADLSRINGKKVGTHYQADQEVRAIVDALQHRFETYLPHRRENFGPTIQLKQGQPASPGGHGDHIHFSVSGSHNCPAPGFFRSIWQYFERWRAREEVCADTDFDPQ